MRIEAFEIRNYRKLASVRLDLARETTLLVGANNSGKTSALIALRSFLRQGKSAFSKNDLTLSRWHEVNDIGNAWASSEVPTMVAPGTWDGLLPSLDVWLRVEDGEVHRVSALIPTLDWNGGLVGVRIALEPENEEELARGFHDVWNASQELKTEWRTRMSEKAGSATGTDTPKTATADPAGRATTATHSQDENGMLTGDGDLSLWPENLIDYLSKNFQKHFKLRYYVLDPTKFREPENDHAVVQNLPDAAEPLLSNPLEHIVLIDEINAQRGLGDAGEAAADGASGRIADTARLSRQLSEYYTHHLDPSDNPGLEDLNALRTIAVAQKDFDARLDEAFKIAFDEMAGLSYPGITDPRIRVASKLSASDSLNHESAVSFALDIAGRPATQDMHLPEGQNGLGYQNLISMVFRLMSFRDRWMRVGKAGKLASNHPIQPIHLVLVEEPEAHLHVQVQQVFAKKAFEVLRKHADLGEKTHLTTQLVISTHSSHIAHELPFESLRYFRRLKAGTNDVAVPTSSIISVGSTFGNSQETQQFVTRYIRIQHADVFFADALIIVEGSAERMLVPHFIEKRHPGLHHAYVTMLEIGGSHAHRLRPLIDALKIPTLVITDLDPQQEGNNAPTARGVKQTTGNPTLRGWWKHSTEIDDLLDAEPDMKVLAGDDQYAVRFAYQTPVVASLVPGEGGEVLPSTFEDALAFENIDFFRKLDGVGLTKKFAHALADGTNLIDTASKLYSSLKTGSKAELALDVMSAPDFDKVKPPHYIEEGLDWLKVQVEKPDLTLEGAARAD